MVLSPRRFTLYCLLQQVDKGVWLIDPPSGRDKHIIRDGDIGGRYNCNKRKKKPANQSVYTPEELDQLDLAGFPEPKTKEQLDEIMHLFHAAVHERDQPTGKNGDADVLHPQCVHQYDVSEFFPSERNRFAKLLLSPRGIEKHRLSCTTGRI
ncbi:hypothetical protein OUZ56_012683 [Daphnia magna]|uniref:Uncharacterized protein n=1 Tax=Daphnia magna TaxID=35525 RepID=A0ABQ9Z3S8_9CRUS|nr:hypothetical protein OUZ56_012683 [Daphnia magna]